MFFFLVCVGDEKMILLTKKLFFKFVCLTKSLVCLAIGELDNIWYFFFYIIWIFLWIIFLGHCATVGLIFFVLRVKYDEFNIHVIIFFLLPSVSEGNSINLVFFLPGMFGNMRFCFIHISSKVISLFFLSIYSSPRFVQIHARFNSHQRT